MLVKCGYIPIHSKFVGRGTHRGVHKGTTNIDCSGKQYVMNIINLIKNDQTNKVNWIETIPNACIASTYFIGKFPVNYSGVEDKLDTHTHWTLTHWSNSEIMRNRSPPTTLRHIHVLRSIKVFFVFTFPFTFVNINSLHVIFFSFRYRIVSRWSYFHNITVMFSWMCISLYIWFDFYRISISVGDTQKRKQPIDPIRVFA